MSTKIVAKVEALIQRAMKSPFQEEARTCAMIAAQLISEHALLSDVVVLREVERIVIPITDEDIDKIIKDHQRERARKGGKARARKLSDAELSESATKAARSRWRRWRAARKAGKTA
jgi:Mg/Co/Ni transporter MgtE